MKHYNDWLTVYIKLDETPNLSTLNEAKRLQASMGTELWDQYIGLLTRYTMMCGMLGVEDADKVMEEIKVLEGAQEKGRIIILLKIIIPLNLIALKYLQN